MAETDIKYLIFLSYLANDLFFDTTCKGHAISYITLDAFLHCTLRYLAKFNTFLYVFIEAINIGSTWMLKKPSEMKLDSLDKKHT